MPHRRKRNPKEYHLICLLTGESHGGYDTLEDARDAAQMTGLQSWQIFYGNRRVEHHDPFRADPPVKVQIEPILRDEA